MNEPDIRKLVEFYGHVHRLKETGRSGWMRRGIGYPEQIASHMYSVALLSMILSRGQRADTEKILKMALIHDLPEALAGDLTPNDKEYKRKRQIEEDKLREIVSALPEDLRREIMSLNAELGEGKSPEARIVGTADKVDMALAAAEYERNGPDLGEFFEIDTSGFAESGIKIIKYLKRMRK